MIIKIAFYSYFRDWTGCSDRNLDFPDSALVRDVIGEIYRLYPKLSEMDKSMLVAVGLEYGDRDQALVDGDELALFPPVQGG